MNAETPSPVATTDLPAAAAQDTAAVLEAMRLLSEHPELSQRELARRLGVSLGKTHYVLHALLDRGLVKIRNFRRSDNKLGYAYFLTPKGMSEKLRLTRSFLARKELEYQALEATIARLRLEVQAHTTCKSGPDRGTA